MDFDGPHCIKRLFPWTALNNRSLKQWSMVFSLRYGLNC